MRGNFVSSMFGKPEDIQPYQDGNEEVILMPPSIQDLWAKEGAFRDRVNNIVMMWVRGDVLHVPTQCILHLDTWFELVAIDSATGICGIHRGETNPYTFIQFPLGQQQHPVEILFTIQNPAEYS